MMEMSPAYVLGGGTEVDEPNRVLAGTESVAGRSDFSADGDVSKDVPGKRDLFVARTPQRL